MAAGHKRARMEVWCAELRGQIKRALLPTDDAALIALREENVQRAAKVAASYALDLLGRDLPAGFTQRIRPMSARDLASVAASHCEDCAKAEPHTRLRTIKEAGTTAEAKRFTCAHCAGGMRLLGHSVEPFTARDDAEFEDWMRRRRPHVAAAREARVARLRVEG